MVSPSEFQKQLLTVQLKIDVLEEEIADMERQWVSAFSKEKEIDSSDRVVDIHQMEEVHLPDDEEHEAPPWCIPIKANVLDFEWSRLYSTTLFDAIVMDPPWQLAPHAPTRGVAIAYDQLSDGQIEELPIAKLQKDGLLFIWVINSKYSVALHLMKTWGYTFVDDLSWVKQTVNRRMAKGHGYYLQHAKESCLVGRKGHPHMAACDVTDVIFGERRGQSQKPERLYELVEELMPQGHYLEIFGRKNNLRDFWTTIGNEL